MKKTSLRSQLILGFSLITIPLIVLLIINNWYAIEVVQKQVAGTNKNLVTINMKQIDQKLTEVEKYLLKTSLLNSDLHTVGSYSMGSEEAVYAKVNTFIMLSHDIAYYSDMDAFFAYSSNSKELIFTSRQSMSYDKKESIRAMLNDIMEKSDLLQSFNTHWAVLNNKGEYALLRVFKSEEGANIGVWVDLSRLLNPFQSLEAGEKGRMLIADSDGTVLAHDINFATNMVSSINLRGALAEKNNLYNLVKYGTGNSKLMIVSQLSQIADIHLVMLLPVKSLLEQLPVFKWVIYITPALAVVFLLLFLLYLQRSITLPVHRLLKGMQKMRSGNFNTRLEPSRLKEFNNINQTFNKMSDEIETLKIDIYEEKIKTQRAELKHLQAQIHPHFFTNCLNLIYNLAQIKNIGLVQKLTFQLVQHLRFTIKTNISSVSLQEELNHIQNYLSIQKVRFPEAFEYQIESNPGMLTYEIPPLTIQPFVENAMEHGFCYKDEEPFTINISMHIEHQSNSVQDYLVINISDNGMGFEPQILGKLQSGEYFQSEFDEHIGIWNVHHRCKLFFRTETLILFENSLQGGAVVTLKLPVDKILREGGHSDVSNIAR